MTIKDKHLKLIKYIKGLERVLIAFSGGVDSTFLLMAAKEALGDNVKAVTIKAPYIPKWEIEEAKHLAREIDVAHEIVEVPVSNEIIKNPKDRCYICKKFIFNKIRDIAIEEDYKYIIDGSNFDDTKDYRPGLRALKELDIVSPLMECELTKKEIRNLSKEYGLPTWDKPAYACLLTRIPYGNELKIEEFDRIEKAERFLMNIGFRAVRVRSHDDLARIEVRKEDISKLLNENVMDKIVVNLKQIGFHYITLDMEGYRTGSFNETIN